ncbi:metal ABC transporter ATP-binding protein [Quadrisphaera oryzae]|uniref:metal ABC transporter ATP-binding protein n=1 Tax=Quadrisphaera TaxID=317661 RepID=UPI0016474026|nr:metal ABC transporter ATP-binding protein [Quadrisphaera sp. RL12-1S]
MDAQQRASTPVLLAQDVRVDLGGHRVLDGVDVSIDSGQLVGLIGANGAGKTTLLRVLLGLQRPTTGAVVRGDGRRGPAGLGYLPQKVALDADTPLRVRDVVQLGIDGGRLGIPLRRSADRRRVEDALDAVGALHLADRRVGELSGGQQQRVLIAHALVAEPAVLLLDEPLANLDPANAADVIALLARIRRERGVAVVLTAHEITTLLPVLDRVVYLAGGRAVTGTPEEVVRPEVLTRLYGRPIQVLRAGGRLVVLADQEAPVPESAPALAGGEPRA